MILHIPHASRVIPPDCRVAFLLDDLALERELDTLTDAFTDELFTCSSATRIIYPVSRLVVDPERYLDDSIEPMAAVGMGVIYGWGQCAVFPGNRNERHTVERCKSCLLTPHG